MKFECILLLVNYFVSGFGVFALKSFNAGDFLLEYHGELIDPALGYELSDQTYIYYFSIKNKHFWYVCDMNFIHLDGYGIYKVCTVSKY